LYSDPQVCRQIASQVKTLVPWLSTPKEHEDDQNGLIITLYSDRTNVREVLGLDGYCFTFAVVVRLDISFEKKEKPPDVRKMYCLTPGIMLIDPDRENTWSGGNIHHVASHLRMSEKSLHDAISPGNKVFKSENPLTIAEEYVAHILEVEENLAMLIVASYLTNGPAS